jgi:hypothetical protein
LLQLLVFQPELVGDFDGAVRDNEPEARALAALLEFTRHSPQLRTTASVVQHFAGTPYEALIREVSGEILHWEEGFEVEAEFAGACDQWRKRHRQQEVEVLLAKSRSQGLSADEKQVLQQLLQR